MSRGKAIEVGSEKAYELVRWTQETPEPDTVEDVLLSGVRGPKDKRTVAVKNLSSRDIAQKRRELAKLNDKPTDEERDAARLVRGTQASLRKAGVKATVTTDREAKTWFALIRVPLDQLRRVWPVEEPTKRR